MLCSGLVVSVALAFAHAQVGSTIENVELPTLAGGKQSLLTNASANVFIFFKPGQEHSRTTMAQIAALGRELSTNAVHWVAIVSDSIPKTNAEAEVEAAGLTMPVLIDTGDSLYGKLGVALEPVTGITDQDHKLVAYQPFTKVNYIAVIRARIRHLLKEITDDELAQVLNPPAATQGGDAAAVHLRLKLAEKLYQAKSYDKALETVKIAIEKDPTVAAAHVLLGQILAAQNNCPAAFGAFDEAAKLDPTNAAALAGKKACAPAAP
jgi:tetratricopeptide (TPR) repeat protein